ncbi:GuaB3 family IMP dehydrogenase-related protein [Mycolicibacterium fortuitum]|jgi:IMP dehydrogenase|uniref:GuaB3 family IMP dehydrogenase-related protein n=5 Tax=Mycolicibacterium fortuitum TaxID=1766 RepID=A0A1A2I2C8_MYCFO|nr:GuaB3 family IMP dehydrogenase-related protein [Mycolicibacterium fortuitum]AIY45549.1 Inosine-5'-monophosphate dehydrogenase [Mycobacterium sp. VKM Ac-1817D]CRL58005.1 IMP dehydrogenase family protein [Mycolicibacterium fortuitum subsp. fortuitum DSM 46621 = ATCC 6841 = JCM 6387]MCA4724812.1 GuaB3 family IMP dehydrogenase-related protein [Mycolicibacterium fortuitum]MCA4754934.1 GuaB3 family IMP dehydrogenase-related protein [Mycolicibacterium fortuitum]MCV7141195.1 GuaB3 family IMP dehydr
MRDMVEIGMGRTARRTYELDDVTIVPSRRTRSSKDVSTAWQLDAYRFEVPVVAHPTDSLVSVEFAIEMGRLGGLGVLNGEGLIGRHADVEEKIAQVIDIAASATDESAATRMLQQLHSAPLDPDLLGAAVARIREAGVTTAVRVSPQNAQALTPTLVAAGIDLLVIQGTIISAERVASDGEPLNLKTFISELDVPVVAGGVLDHRTALHLMRTGAAGVIVGYGSTAGVTTSDEVLGISVPMATAIADAAAARREYLDETGGRYVHVLADGDIHTSGDLAKAIACGADAVVLGTPLAVSNEALGGGWFWPSAAAHPSLPRGALLQVAVGDRPGLEQVLNGPSDDPFGSLNLVGGLRRSMAKAGYCDLKEFQKVGLSVGS